MAGLFGSTKKAKTSRATSMRVQTSLEGKALAVGWGQARIAANLIWYGDFRSSGGDQGGKGGLAGGGGKGKQQQVTYSAAVVAGLCAGPIQGVLRAWDNKTVKTLARLNLVAFLGAQNQAPWGYLTSRHADKALAYRGLAYVAAGPMNLGSSAELPNLAYEVLFGAANAIAGKPDADPAVIVGDLLTNARYGVGLDAARVASLDVYSAYCRAAGLVLSPVLTEQASAQDVLGEWLQATNASAVWSGGKIAIVPYGDRDLDAHGAIYQAPAAPLYDLDDDDFIALDGGAPIQVARRATNEAKNAIKVEFLDRANAYNPAVRQAKDDASISIHGLRVADPRSWHFICDADAAQAAAELLLGREAVRNTYKFTLGPEYILLDPMDIVSITDIGLGLDRQWVRIVEIEEGDDRTLTITAEDYLAGAGTAPIVAAGEPNDGYVADYEAAPGGINEPVIFETTYDLAGGYEVWGAVSGVNHALWGGCDVYASYGGATYELVGRVTTAARGGALSAPLEAVAPATTGRTIDQAHILSVNLASSGADLTSATQADAEAGNTLCWVDGELLAYATANLTGPNAYDLAYLVRGLYGTENKIYPHAAGAPFARLDSGIVRIPYNEGRIGQTIYLKFVSFNIWGGGEQSLADVEPHLYTLQGVGKPTGLSLNKMGLVVKYDDIAPSVLDALHLERLQADDMALTLHLGEMLDRAAAVTETRARTAAAQAGVVQTTQALAGLEGAFASYRVEATAAFDSMSAQVTQQFNALSDGLAAQAAASLQVVAAGAAGEGLAQLELAAQSDLAAGVSAALRLRVRQSVAGGFADAGQRIEILPDGTSRIVFDASKIYFGSSATKFVPFVIDAVSNEVVMQGVARIGSSIKSLATMPNGDPVMELDFVNGRLTISQGS